MVDLSSLYDTVTVRVQEICCGFDETVARFGTTASSFISSCKQQLHTSNTRYFADFSTEYYATFV